jgi:glycine/D-amino acid oxidase-like deaminating enzyme
MARILSDFAYGDAPIQTCFWGQSKVEAPKAQGDLHAKVAIVGAGFTGLSAALHLGQEGVDVVVLDAKSPGWGATGRNGGFCCLGGMALTDGMLAKRYGADGTSAWRATEVAAITLVRDLLNEHAIQADTHSDGETILAHSARAMKALRAEQAKADAAYGAASILHEAEELPALGMKGRYFGALTLPHGFGLNPRKYADGLAQAAIKAGARLYSNSPVRAVTPQNGGFTLTTSAARIRAEKVIFATNGYSSEDVPPWMRGRYLPLQSNVLVTRALTPDEIAEGWSSPQMAYTYQTLLHYFRLLPNGQFLFGMRGGLFSGARAFASLQKRTRRQFEHAFPFWKHVETPYSWNGALAFAYDLSPYVGPVPEMPGAFVGFAYHGNGVAMATHSGAILARLALGQDAGDHYPQIMQDVPKRFPLGRYRRLLMAPAYVAAALSGR